MCKSNQDILCGLCFLAISAAFALQMHELEDVTRVFPAALLTVIALGGVWFVGKGIYLKRRDNSSCETESVAWKKVAIIAAIALFTQFCYQFWASLSARLPLFFARP